MGAAEDGGNKRLDSHCRGRRNLEEKEADSCQSCEEEKKNGGRGGGREGAEKTCWRNDQLTTPERAYASMLS
jgi:hypothetical protein